MRGGWGWLLGHHDPSADRTRHLPLPSGQVSPAARSPASTRSGWGPSAASALLRAPCAGDRRNDFRTIVFANGCGFLDYQVFEDRQLVVIDELTSLGD